VTKPRLTLDTSCCGKIRDSKNRGLIEAHLDRTFRRVLSAQTLWEILDAIDGGDGTHFGKDRELLRIAVGDPNKLLALPTPMSFAIEHALRRPAPEVALTPKHFERMVTVVMKATNRDELYQGVRMSGAVRQLTAFDPTVVRTQQEQGEREHVKRLKRGRAKQLPFPPPEAWALLLANDLGVRLSESDARKLMAELDAAYLFDKHVWRVALNQKNPYNFEKHQNDWIDLQQTMYLCDKRLYLMTSDKGIVTKTGSSSQARRVLYLPTYLNAQGIQL